MSVVRNVVRHMVTEVACVLELTTEPQGTKEKKVTRAEASTERLLVIVTRFMAATASCSGIMEKSSCRSINM